MISLLGLEGRNIQWINLNKLVNRSFPLTSSFLASYAARSASVARAAFPRRFNLATHNPLRDWAWLLSFWYRALAWMRTTISEDALYNPNK